MGNTTTGTCRLSYSQTGQRSDLTFHIVLVSSGLSTLERYRMNQKLMTCGGKLEVTERYACGV